MPTQDRPTTAGTTQTPANVLSIQTPAMGHGTYGRMIRRYLAQTETCTVDSVWADEHKSVTDKVLNRLLFLKVPGGEIARRNLDLRRFRSELGAGLLGRSQVRHHLQSRRYDVLHFHTQVPAYRSADLMQNIPTVLSGDMTSVQVAQEYEERDRWTFTPNIRLERRLYNAAAHIVLWSEWARRSVTDDYGIDPAKTSVIIPGVDLAALPPGAERNTPAGSPVKLLFVGNDFERKGGADVLDVFLREFSSVAELHLVTSAAIECTHPRVHVHHGVAAYSPEWIALYRSMDAFVMPTYKEALGLVFMEAMAAGLPVVATRISAIPEIVSEGETGILIAPGNRHALAEALRALINDADLRRRMGVMARQKAVCQFDAAANFGRLGAVFAAAGHMRKNSS